MATAAPDQNPDGSSLASKDLSKEEALWVYAQMMNTLDASNLEPMLAEDFHYASQWVLPEITSKADYLAYITSKFMLYQLFFAFYFQ